MRSIIFIILGIATIMAASSLVSAADYNFASAQANKTITIIAGGEGTGTIYFYNISGDRITHVTLEVIQAPDNWQVEIQPPLTETKVEIGGNIVTVVENLYVEPSEVLSEKPDTSPEGTVYLPIPDQGYALAKIATIIVHVPASEATGTQEEIVISGVAKWLGQSGAAAISQSRDFTFTVKVIPEPTDSEEKIIAEPVEETEDKEIQEAAEDTSGLKTDTENTEDTETASEVTIAVEETPAAQDSNANDESQNVIGKWLPAIIAAVIVILGAIIVPLFIRRRHG